MRLPLIPILIVLVLGILVDICIYRRLRTLRTHRWLCVAYTVVAILADIALLTIIFLPKGDGDDAYLRRIMWTLYAYMSLYLPKYVYTVFSLIGRGIGALVRKPLRWIGMIGAIIGVAIFGGMWWGALAGRFDTEIVEVDVTVPDLPDAFDGYRIVQISDLHVGSYGGDTSYLESLVDTVNSLHADAILFTGDIVNRHSAELPPYMDVLSRLSAPHGIWSIMGNHDYGDYYSWPSDAEHAADADSLKAMESRMGWRMLNNAHAWLRAGTDSIALIGVENIGDPPFKCYGDLSRAYPNLADSNVKILLTHNPAHWVDSIAPCSDRNVALTLSGHTHAMQMRIFGWSPAAFRYKTWAGLYEAPDSSPRSLYVNIGIGEVGIPARIGSARPEVTLITLRKQDR